MKKQLGKLLLGALSLTLILIIALAVKIYSFSANTSSRSADVAIVLGAAVWNGQPSPVFAERINHGIHLYQTGQASNLIFTGGVGINDQIAESEVARTYAVEQGVPIENIFIEKNSHITYENLYEACLIMTDKQFESALIVSDPLHMQRSIQIAKDIGIESYPSPTPTTLYKTWRSQSGSLAYETFFFLVHMKDKVFNLVEKCEYTT